MKAAVVDLDTGELASERVRVPTPKPATPEAMADVAAGLVRTHGWSGPIGVGFPGIVRHGVVHSAANLDPSWMAVDADALFTGACGADVAMVNDADAAGLAEIRWGAGRDIAGVVLVLTFGTGIGSGLFVDGTLVPNTELGHLELDGRDAESHAAASVREREGIGWKEWAPSCRALPPPRRDALLARSDHRRWWSVEGGRHLVAVGVDRHPDRAGGDVQQRRHRRCRVGGAPRPPLSSSCSGVAAQRSSAGPFERPRYQSVAIVSATIGATKNTATSPYASRET